MEHVFPLNMRHEPLVSGVLLTVPYKILVPSVTNRCRVCTASVCGGSNVSACGCWSGNIMIKARSKSGTLPGGEFDWGGTSLK